MYIRKVYYKIIIASLLLIFISYTAVYAGNGIKLIGYGPVQRAMGGASVGLPLDANTVITNPAGMQDVGKRADLGVTLSVAAARYNATSNFILPQILENGNTFVSDTDPMLIPAVGITFPLNKTIAIGVGLHGTSGVEIKYKRNLYRNITYVEYKCLQITPAISFSYEDIVSFGLAAAINYATLAFEAVAPGQWAHNNGGAAGGGYILSTLVKPLNALDLELPKDLLSLGLVYQSEISFALFEFDTALGTDKLELNSPRTLTFGVGVKPSNKVRLAFDLEWINWKNVLGKNQPEYRTNVTASTPWNVRWTNQVVCKVGIAYDVLEKMIVEKLTVRAGYNYGKHPLTKERPFEGIALPAITEHHITCGLGADLIENLALNVAFMFAPKIKYNMSSPGDFLDDANITTYAWSLDAGLAFKF